MECGMRNGRRTNWAPMFVCSGLILSSNGFASARLLQWRQDDAAKAASTADKAAMETSITEASSLSSIIAPTAAPQGAAASAANGTTLNGTEAAVSSSAAAASASATVNPLNGTDDPNECHVNNPIGSEFTGNPFCMPSAGQIVIAPSLLEVQWDTFIFAPNSTDNVTLSHFVNQPDKTASEDPLWSESMPNSRGITYINMTNAYLTSGTTANLTLFIESTAVTGGRLILTGPTFTLVNSTAVNNSSSTSSPSKSSKKLGEEVGIPVGLVVFGVALFVIGAFICLRRRQKNFAAAKPRSKKVAAAAPIATRSHRRDLSFHDEPTRGVELQDRNRKGEDTWDWGSPLSSPTSGSRGSNAFRDELGRQKNSRGY